MDGKISVIVPVYNVEKYLEACIDSILKQKYENIELLLINDGSKDGSLSLCKSYEKKDSRVVVIDQENRGVSSARNAGLKKASGEWISFIDADDWIDADTFEWAIKTQNQFDSDIVMWNRIDEYENKKIYCRYADDRLNISTDTELEMFKKRVFTGYSQKGKKDNGSKNIYAKLIKKRLINDNDICFDEQLKHHEDMIFMMEVFEKTKNIYLENRFYYHRRMHDGSTIHKFYPGIVQDNNLTSYKYKQFLESNNKNVEYYEFYAGMHVYWMMQVFQLYLFHPECKKRFFQKLQEVKKMLNKEPYGTVFEKIPNSIVFPKKIFFFLAKRKFALLLVIYSRIYGRMKG